MPDYSYRGKMSLHPYDPRFTAIAPPSTGIFDEPQMSICFNVEWAGHIDGVLSRLLWLDAWAGTPEQQEFAVDQITRLLVSMIARNPCGTGDCMSECCDDIVERLEAIEALLIAKSKKTPQEIKEDVVAVEQSYEDYLETTDAAYGGDVTNLHPDMAYGDDNDPIRDQALCFICRRFVDICCDWIVTNINMKVANQQTVLNIASFIGSAADLLGRIFAETAFGTMFENIDLTLDLEVQAATEWITSVTEEQLSVYQDMDARQELACAWYNELKGETPTLSRFLSSLYAADVSGHAATIRTKLGDALTPVAVPQQPDGEHLYFIWADLWQQAYDGANAGIVPDCLCEEPPEPRDPVINSEWDPAHIAGTIEGPDEDGFYTATSGTRASDEAITLMDSTGRPFVLTSITYSEPLACQAWLLEGSLDHIACGVGDQYHGETVDEYTVTFTAGGHRTMRFKMFGPS